MNRASFGASGLVVGGLICQEAGAGLAVLLFPSVGAVGMVMLRATQTDDEAIGAQQAGLADSFLAMLLAP